MSTTKPWGVVSRYGAALAVVVAALGVRAALDPLLGDTTPLFVSVLAVAVAAGFGGWGPGLLATVASVLGGMYFFRFRSDLPHWLGRMSPGEWTRLGVFVSAGLLMSGLGGACRATRRRLEHQASVLRLSEERFRTLVETVHDYAIFLLDAGGRVASWNGGAARIKGYRFDEIVGRHFSAFYTPEDVAAGLPEQTLRLAAEHGHSAVEGWRVRKDGSRFWADVVTTALYDADGKLQGYSKVARDLSERHQMEDALRLSVARLELANRELMLRQRQDAADAPSSETAPRCGLAALADPRALDVPSPEHAPATAAAPASPCPVESVTVT